MDNSATRSKYQFTVRTLLFLMLCIAGLLAGYRVGLERGYTAGADKRRSEKLMTVVYDVSDVVSYSVKDNVPGGWRPARVDERTPATADFDALIEVMQGTVGIDEWEDLGGPGSIREVPDKLSLVVRQYAYIHEEIESLFRSLSNKTKKNENKETDSIEDD